MKGVPLYGEGPLVVLCVVGAAVDSAFLCCRELLVAAGKNLYEYTLSDDIFACKVFKQGDVLFQLADKYYCSVSTLE